MHHQKAFLKKRAFSCGDFFLGGVGNKYHSVRIYRFRKRGIIKKYINANILIMYF